MSTVLSTTSPCAKKQHRCSWCWERIESGETYKRYRWVAGNDAGTEKMHPECYEAMIELAREDGGWIEFMPGDNRRGCNCGRELDCKRCGERAALTATGRKAQP